MALVEASALITPGQAAFVASQRVARLATASSDGRPQVVPVCFAMSGTQRIYIALDEKPKSVSPLRLKRVRNILANPHVSLLVDTYSEDWSRLGYVMINGTAALEDAGTPAHREALELLREKYPQYRAMRLETTPLIAITPHSSHAWSGAASTTDRDDPRAGRSHLDFSSLARGRHVVRRFMPTPVPREAVERTIEAAGWAPSPHGAQPWRFVVVTLPEVKAALAQAMSAEWRRNLEMDGQTPDIVEDRLRKSQARILGSPVLVVPCLYMEDMHDYPDPKRQQAEITMAVQSLGAAVQNMLLSAYSLGLDTGWMCAPLFCSEIVREALGLPGSLVPHALINMGYGAKDPPRRPHRPVSELIYSYK